MEENLHEELEEIASALGNKQGWSYWREDDYIAVNFPYGTHDTVYWTKEQGLKELAYFVNDLEKRLLKAKKVLEKYCPNKDEETKGGDGDANN